MTKIKIEIKNRFTGKVIFELETENNTIKNTVETAVKQGVSLSGANMSGADMSGANMSGANMSGANMYRADMYRADMSGADIDQIKADFFLILLYAKNEVLGLENALINGMVDGSTYSGECCCLVGTIANVKGCNYEMLDGIKPKSSRPAERWFLGIRKGDTPETNQISKITLEWIEEFKKLLNL